MKALILVNTLQSINSFNYSNHIGMLTYTAKRFPNDEFIFFTPHRTSIDNARNAAAKMALAANCDYLMFLDDDVLVPPTAFEQLYLADKDVIAGLVYLRGYPFEVMAFKEVNGDNALHQIQLKYFPAKEVEDNIGEVLPCDAVGFSCCLIKCDVLQALEPPYFVTGTLNTEDVYFCLRSRELEPRPGIYLHTGIECGHLLNPEPIEFKNRHAMRTYCEEIEKLRQMNQPSQDELNNPRFLSYIESHKAKLQSA